MNGEGVSDDSPSTQECYYRIVLHRHMFCAAQLSTNPLFGPSNDVLIRMGAKRNRSILDEGQAWRLITPLYLHGGVVHCLINNVVMLQLGLRLEAAHGALRVGAVYLASGIFGVIMSAVLAPHSISVGASGAIFGLMGACLGEVLQNWRLYARPCTALCQLTLSAALQLVLGTTPTIDNFEHFFGFVMGLVSALCLLISPRAPRPGWPMAAKCQQQLLQVVAASLAYLLFVAGLLALYGGWDAYSFCPWCGKISCLPFPWGCDPMARGSCWWDCSTCSSGGLAGEAFWRGSELNGTVILSCPSLREGSKGGFENVSIWPINVTGMTSMALIELCKHQCRDAFI